MIFDENNFPKDQNADDYMDSCRLAGLMSLFNHPKQPNLLKYFISYATPVRHPNRSPENNYKNFTRDQLMPLVAGMYKQELQLQVSTLFYRYKKNNWFMDNTELDHPNTVKKFPNGPDWLSPSHRMHLKLCAKYPLKEVTSLERLWLKADIYFNTKIKPWNEQNQLISKIVIAGPEYVKLWQSLHPDWKKSINNYWGGWRGENEFAEFIISKLEQY